MTTRLKRDQREFKYISTDRIIPNDRNPRSAPSFTKEQLLQLRKSIEAHGILEPLVIQPYRQGQYLLIEGERRWTVAKDLGIKQVPAMVVQRLEGDDQVVVMYNLHENRRGWEMADHLRAIKELMANRPSASEEELAEELGMSIATLRNRLQVLEMGDKVVRDIQQGKLDYTSALRSYEAARTITKKRPELAEKLGGIPEIEKRLVAKAEEVGGLSHELLTGKQDLADTKAVPDELIEQYIKTPSATLRSLRSAHRPAEEKKQVSDLTKEVTRIEKEIAGFDADLGSAPNLRRLRDHLVGLIEVAEQLERRIVEAILEAEKRANAPKPKKRPKQETVQQRAQKAADAETKAKLDEQVEKALDGDGKKRAAARRKVGAKPRRRTAAKK